MSALFRETAVGKLVHYVSKGRLLQYPEEVEGFVIPESLFKLPSPLASLEPVDEQTLVDAEAATAEKLPKSTPSTPSGTIIVTWYSDTDPSNPQNWGAFKKSLVTFVVCTLTFAMYGGAGIITSGFPSLMNEFGIGIEEVTTSLALYIVGYGSGALLFSPLSEIPQFGRNPFYWAPFVAFVAFQAGAARVPTFAGLVILRLLTGFCGSPVLSTGGATLGDLYNPFQIPTAFSVWVLPAFCAPAIGPLIGNFAVQAHNWRWSMYELLWIAGFAVIFLLLVMPETSHSNILLRRAERLRKLTGNPNFKSKSELDHANETAGDVFKKAILRPFAITILDPSILFANVYTGLVYAFYYTFFDAFPITFGPEIFNFSYGAQGIAYLSIVVGALVGFIAYVLYQQIYMNGHFYPTKGWPANEKRLEPALLSSTLAPAGLFIFAWTSRASAHWIGPIVGTAIYSAANFITLQSLFFYIVLSYPEYAASILASNDFIRAMFAAGFLFDGTPMFKTLGIDGGVSLLAGLTCLGIPGIFAIHHYGARLRARSRFAVADA